jgi:mannosyltransferase
MPHRRDVAIVLALTGVAAVLRFSTLDHQSFWIDEAETARLLHLPLHGFFDALREQTSPPLFYALAWAWSQVFGTGEVGLRSLSAIFGVLTVPVAYLLARRVAGPRAALLAGAFVATSPEMVWFSQEARPYSTVVLLAGLSLYGAVRAVQEGRRRWLALWAAGAALGLAIQYFTLFIVVPEAVWLLWALRARGRGRDALVALGAVACTALVLLPLAATQAGRGYWPYYSQLPLAVRVRSIPGALLLGEGRPRPAYVLVAFALTLALAALALAVAARGRDRAYVRPVIAIGALGVVVPIVLAVAGMDYIAPHNLMAAWMPLLVGVAAGVAGRTAAPRWLWIGLASCAINVVVVALVLTDPAYQRDDWRGAIATLGPAAEARALVFPAGHNSAVVYYARGSRPPATAPGLRTVALSEIDVLVAGEPAEPPPRLPATLQAPAPGFTEVSRRMVQRIVVVRFRSDRPQVVPVATLTRAQDGMASVGMLVQCPGGCVQPFLAATPTSG